MTNNRNPRPRSRLRRNRLVAGLTAVCIAAGLGGTAAADRIDDAPSLVRAAPGGPVLDDVTLSQLADELETLDLVLTISPATDDSPGDVSPEPAESSIDDGPFGEFGVSEDPFAGMTDAEIDALGDEEFFAILDAAGWSDGYLEDGDWDDGPFGEFGVSEDPFAGMTDAEIDALSDEEFYAILDAAGWSDGYLEDGDWDGGSPDDGGDGAPLAGFPVDGDQLDSSAAPPAVAREAEAIWARFVELIPADQREMVVGFELAPEEESGAYVYPTDQDPSKWVLGVSGGLGSDLDFTLVHEFGHLLTLQVKEVPPGGDPDSCATYYTGEGCALSGSTFARFVKAFWPQDMIDEILRIEESGDWDAYDAFYDRHPDSFVTNYATTNPGEDLAETFTVFVMNERPTGDTVANQKVQFLWTDPAMVNLRNQIRADL